MNVRRHNFCSIISTTILDFFPNCVIYVLVCCMGSSLSAVLQKSFKTIHFLHNLFLQTKDFRTIEEIFFRFLCIKMTLLQPGLFSQQCSLKFVNALMCFLRNVNTPSSKLVNRGRLDLLS